MEDRTTETQVASSLLVGRIAAYFDWNWYLPVGDVGSALTPTKQERIEAIAKRLQIDIPMGETAARSYAEALIEVDPVNAELEAWEARYTFLCIQTQKIADERDTALAENGRLREALEPLAALQMPKKRKHNACYFSISYTDIERAKQALHKPRSGDRRKNQLEPPFLRPGKWVTGSTRTGPTDRRKP